MEDEDYNDGNYILNSNCINKQMFYLTPDFGLPLI